MDLPCVAFIFRLQTIQYRLPSCARRMRTARDRTKKKKNEAIGSKSVEPHRSQEHSESYQVLYCGTIHVSDQTGNRPISAHT